VEEPRVLCCGVIAGSRGRRFCTKVGCGFKAHKTQKVVVAANMLYVCGRKDQARIEPSLPTSKLPADMTLEFIVGQEKTVVVWTSYFLSLIAKQNREVIFGASPEPGVTHGFEEIETPSLDQFSQVDIDFQTPRKLKLSDLLAVGAEALPMPLKKPADIKSFPLPGNKSTKPTKFAAAQHFGIQTVLGEWNRVLENFELLFEELGSLGTGEKKYRAALTQTIMKLQSGVGDANRRALILAARLGQDTDASDQGLITVWEAIGELKGKVGALGQSIATGRQEVVNSSRIANDALATVSVAAADLASMQAEFVAEKFRSSNLGLSLANLGASYVTMVSQMKKSVADIEVKVAGIMKTGLAGAPGGAAPPVQAYGVSWGLGGAGMTSPTTQEFSELQIKVVAVEAELDARTQAGALGVGGGSGFGSGGDPGLQIEKILTRIGDMESRISDESIEMNGSVFSSGNGVAIWCVSNDVESCGMFWDVFSVLVVTPPKKQTGKERADESFASQRTETTTFENDLGASMSHIRPAPLYRKNHMVLGGSPNYKLGLGRVFHMQNGWEAPPPTR
jgi:hypothetical protein